MCGVTGIVQAGFIYIITIATPTLWHCLIVPMLQLGETVLNTVL